MSNKTTGNTAEDIDKDFANAARVKASISLQTPNR